MKSLLYFLVILAGFGCTKDWLDEKSNRSQVVPATLRDFQAILDYDLYMNGTLTGGGGTTPSLGELACDDYYLLNSHYSTATELERNAYTWAKEVYMGAPVIDWNFIYRSIFHANVVLDGVKEIVRDDINKADWDNCKGSGLFYRAIGFFNIAQVFAKPYDAATASNDPGIPLRLNASVAMTSVRSTIKETYERIIKDLEEALPLLPDMPLYKTRPSRAAAHALLARVYLTMGNYQRALEESGACLAIRNTLMDYNTINSSTAYPFPLFNDEVIFFSRLVQYNSLFIPRYKVDTLLYKSYDANDRRKTLFFRTETDGTRTVRGDYNGSATPFGGLATDEVYLIKAECLARLNQKAGALAVLNQLLQKRWVTGTFIPYGIADEPNALKIILAERRKELIERGLRWIDLRRLNKETEFAITLKRIVNGVEYTLPPNSARYVFAIPDEVIALTGMQQNER